MYELSLLLLLQAIITALQLFITLNQAVVTADVFLLICNLDSILRYAFADVSREYIHLIVKLITFSEPYKDSGTQGHCYYKKDKIKAKVKEALDKNIRLSCHAIGESAIDQITEIYSELENRIPREGAMMRIDHFEFPSEKAAELIKKLPLAITVQPGFSWIDKHFLKIYEQFLPESIINRQLPLKDLMNSDVCVCGSSDSPVQSVNPYEQMLGMVDFYLSDQSITPMRHLKLTQ